MASKKQNYKEVIISMIDEYMEKAFNADDKESQEKYRTAIHQMEKLLLTITELE